MPVGNVCANVYSRFSLSISALSFAPSTAPLSFSWLRQRDRLAVVIEVHQHGHVLLRPADAHLHAIDQAVEHVRGVELAVDELVAHRRPRRFLARHDLDAVFLVELHHRRDHHRRAVGERNEADLHLASFPVRRTGGPRAGAQSAGSSSAHQRRSARLRRELARAAARDSAAWRLRMLGDRRFASERTCVIELLALVGG
mgnify:CR=1 FL=1